MSNAPRRRALSRVSRELGGPRARKQHRRVLVRFARQRAVQEREMAAAAEAMLVEEFGEAELEADLAEPGPPKLVWGHGCGPKQQQALADDAEWAQAADPT